jgi:PhnB protein
MKDTTTYLIFDGTCREAMTFYSKCLGGELMMSPFSDMPGNSPPGAGDRIMHARISVGKTMLMASDSMPGMPFQQGDNFSISIDCESKEEVDRLFNALAEGGKVKMAQQDTFWGAYFGMLTDRYGIGWMFNFEKPKAGG